MKHIMKTGIVCLMVLGFAGWAQATSNTYTVNMCGASAQAGFWQQAGAAVVQSALNCSSAVLDSSADGKKLIVKANSCDADGDGSQDDTVYVRYTASSSSTGCSKYDCEDEDYAIAANCDFSDTVKKECGSTYEQAPCMMGCADVDCSTITATTYGYYTGREGALEDGESKEDFGNANGYAPATAYANTYKGVTVPFGFIVNNSVKDHYCEYTGVDEDAHLAYDKRGWECDPNETDALSCRGDYKCLDTDEDGTGVCLDGNQIAAEGDEVDTVLDEGENTCEDASECKMASSLVSCEEQPLKGISRLMAIHIFANKVGLWSDFGPSFVDLPIVKCMRHGGSGTHQTLINTVFRGDASVKTTTVNSPTPFQPGQYVWHYKSSSDLTRDCVAYYAGGIGYVDADKVMYRSKIGKTQSAEGAYNDYYDDDSTVTEDDFVMEDGIHQLMYQGVAPSRNDVANGKYNFWAAQQCFTDSCTTGVYATILDDIMTEASNASYLDFDNFGQRAYFWATQGEMQVQKTTEYSYPTRK